MAAVTTSGSAPDAHGSSAPVLEFVCLFTHDLRRKQKRWQDGRLKYHLFNKRVMVYDDRGNFVGDMYWRRDWEFDEGEEVELERGGVIVQVSECVGRQNQDLSELLDKRVQEKEQRAAVRPPVPFVPNHTPLSVSRTPVPRDHFQTRHRPLNHLLGTPSGHHGRAVVPTESPYEQRHSPDQTPNELSNSRASKKRRYDDLPSSKMGYAQSLFGAPLTLSGVPLSSAPARRPAVSKSQPRVEISSSQEDGNRISRPIDITEEPLGRPIQRRGMADTRQHNLMEQPGRAESALSTTSKPAVHKERMTSNRDAERENAQPSTRDLGTIRGVSSHFSNTFSGNQRRASLLANIGAKTVQSKSTDNGTTGYQARIMETIREPQAPKPPEPVPPILLEDDDDPEEGEMTMPPNKTSNVAGSKRNAPEIQKQPRAKRTKDLLQSNSPSHMEVDHDTTSVPAPDAVTTTEQAPKEPRTELRLRSRQKRGLLLMSEMTKKAPSKKAQRSSTGPSPSKSVDINAEKREDIPQDGAQDQPDGENSNTMPPDPNFSCYPSTRDAPQVDDEDPFASPPTSPKALPRKATATTIRKQHNEPETMGERDIIEDNEAIVLDNSSPEPSKRTNVRRRPQSNEPVYDIPENTDDEQVPLHKGKTIKPRKSEMSGNRAKKRTKEQRAEDVGSDLDQSPKARKKRTSTRKTGKTSPKQKPGKSSRSRSDKKRQLPEDLSAEDSEEDMPVVPRAPRLAKLNRKSIKSREVFGFVMSSSPPPPAYGIANPLPTLDEDPFQTPDIPALVSTKAKAAKSEAPRVPTSAEQATSQSRVMVSTSAPSLQRHNSLPDRVHIDSTSKDAPGAPLLPPAFTEKPSGGESNQRLDPASSAAVTAQAALKDFTPSTGAGQQSVADRTYGTASSPSSAAKNVSHGVQPTIHAEDKSGLHPESHNTPDSPRRLTSATAQPLKESPAHTVISDGPIMPLPPPPPPPPPAAAAAALPKKIVNPASRGRKAALKSDAAGQIPQSILPPVDPLAERPNILASRGNMRPAGGGGGTGAEERPKFKMTFPGFVSAREGGPWSREAHDLLESGRPG